MSDSWWINDCTKTISYKSIAVSFIHAKVSNSKYEYPILDKLGIETSDLQENFIHTIHLKILFKE